MNNKKIFPKEFIENSYEQIISEMSTTTKSIYYSLVCSLVLGIIMSMFVPVDIGVTALGTIKTASEHVIITSPIDGKLESYIKQIGERVNKNDTLFTVWSQSIDVSLPSLEDKRYDMEQKLHDLKCLTSNASNIKLTTQKYQNDYRLFNSELERLRENCLVAKKQFEGTEMLHKKGFVSTNEYDESKRTFVECNSAKESYMRKRILEWEIEKDNIEEELRNISIQIESIRIKSSETVICSPISGSVHLLSNISNGSYVHNGQQLLELTPEGDLQAECLVSTRDIGLINSGMKARIRIDAFNYTQWGIIKGTVTNISPDVITLEGGSYYRVYCKLSKDYLELNNGFKGYIKKGMGLSARFVVSERTVFQLLYEKIDNWVNPTIKRH